MWFIPILTKTDNDTVKYTEKVTMDENGLRMDWIFKKLPVLTVHYSSFSR